MYPDPYDTTRVVLVSNPAAGGGFTYTPSGAEWTLVLAVCFKLVTDANAASRLVSLDYIGGDAGVLARHSSGYTQATGLTSQYTFAQELNVYGANDAASIGAPLTPVWLRLGQKVTVNLTNHQVGDQISSAYVTIDQRAAIVEPEE